MHTSNHLQRTSLSLVLSSLLIVGCGGGGGGGDGGTATQSGSQTSGSQSSDATGAPGGQSSGNGSTPGGTGTQTPPATSASAMTMSCPDGPSYQCSGSSIIKVDNGVGLTSSGVQVFGMSSVDATAGASGLKPGSFASGAIAELRVNKDSNTGVITTPALLLSNLGISWDKRTERPRIIETFYPVKEARITLNEKGAVVISPLPPSSDLGFYDYATKGRSGTQENYANNVYFPRDPSNPARCPAELPRDSIQCRTETIGIQSRAGTWRTGGGNPDSANAVRFHEDGDVHSGNAASGNPPILPGGTGLGAPFPGSKGYRVLDNYGYQYANLGAWLTQDTVDIVEWTGGPGIDEHNQNRRGILAFGDVTRPGNVPVTGEATYRGIAYGWDAANATDEPGAFNVPAVVTVNFATRQATVTVQNIGTAAFSATMKVDMSGVDFANYLTGVVDNGTVRGGVSSRYFGPSTNGAAPPEIGGTFSLNGAETGRTVLGGFIARRQ